MNVATRQLESTPDKDPSAPWRNDLIRQLVAAVRGFVFVLDRSLCVLLANRGAGARTAEQLRGVPITVCFPLPLRPQALASMHRVLATGQSDACTAEVEGADG